MIFRWQLIVLYVSSGPEFLVPSCTDCSNTLAYYVGHLILDFGSSRSRSMVWHSVDTPKSVERLVYNLLNDWSFWLRLVLKIDAFPAVHFTWQTLETAVYILKID